MATEQIRPEPVENDQRKAVLNAARTENPQAMNRALRALTPGQRISIRALAINNWAKELRGRLQPLLTIMDSIDREAQGIHDRAVKAATPDEQPETPAPDTRASIAPGTAIAHKSPAATGTTIPSPSTVPSPARDIRAKTAAPRQPTTTDSAPDARAKTKAPQPPIAPGPAHGTRTIPATQENIKVAEGRI